MHNNSICQGGDKLGSCLAGELFILHCQGNHGWKVFLGEGKGQVEEVPGDAV